MTAEQIEDFAEILGIECLKIDARSQVGDIKNQLRWNEAFYGGRYGEFLRPLRAARRVRARLDTFAKVHRCKLWTG